MARGCITGWHEVGKGTKRRPEDKKALAENWGRIFGKKRCMEMAHLEGDSFMPAGVPQEDK
jgi:hypothetical protein